MCSDVNVFRPFVMRWISVRHMHPWLSQCITVASLCWNPKSFIKGPAGLVPTNEMRTCVHLKKMVTWHKPSRDSLFFLLVHVTWLSLHFICGKNTLD
jgi:hypothetical protein